MFNPNDHCDDPYPPSSSSVPQNVEHALDRHVGIAAAADRLGPLIRASLTEAEFPRDGMGIPSEWRGLELALEDGSWQARPLPHPFCSLSFSLTLNAAAAPSWKL